MTNSTDKRPISPYLIGPYYRPQLTSMLSISSRLAGIFMTIVSIPLMVAWLIALTAGPTAYATVTGLLGTWPGQALSFISLFCICYHFANGIRHLVWDTGAMMEIRQVYTSGYVMVACAVAMFGATVWGALS